MDASALERIAARLNAADVMQGPAGLEAKASSIVGLDGVWLIVVRTFHDRPDGSPSVEVGLLDEPDRHGFYVAWAVADQDYPIVAETGSEDVVCALVGLMLRDGLGLPASEVRP